MTHQGTKRFLRELQNQDEPEQENVNESNDDNNDDNDESIDGSTNQSRHEDDNDDDNDNENDEIEEDNGNDDGPPKKRQKLDKQERKEKRDNMDYHTHAHKTKELKTFEDALDCIYDKWDREFKSAIWDGIDLFCQKAFNGNASYQLPSAIKNVICLHLRPRMIVRPYWRPQITKMLDENVYLDKIDSLREKLAYLCHEWCDDTRSRYDDDDDDELEKCKKELNEKLNEIKALNNAKEKEYGDIKILFSSKFGGLPYLSKNDEWPKCGDKDCQRRMKLFLQINFDQLPNEFMHNIFILPFLHQNEYKGCLLQLFYCVECFHQRDIYSCPSHCVRLIKIKKDENSKEKEKENENENKKDNGLINLIDDYKEVSEIKKMWLIKRQSQKMETEADDIDHFYGKNHYCAKEGFGYFIENWIKRDDTCNNSLPYKDDLQDEFSKCFEHKLVANMVTRYNQDNDKDNESDENEDIDISENDKKKKKAMSKDNSEPVQEMDGDKPIKVESKLEFTNKFMENDGFEEMWENWDDWKQCHLWDDSKELTKQMPGRHNKIGGYPKWVQGIYYPSCKVDNCHESMNVFLFQFEYNILANEIDFGYYCSGFPGEKAIGYLLACPNHPKSMTLLWSYDYC